MLIAARALLGVAAATLAPSTLSLIRNMFLDPRERTMAIGVWITSYSAGAAIGPLIGGVLLQHFWWGSVFLITVPVMVLLLVARAAAAARVPRPERGPARSRQRRAVAGCRAGGDLRAEAHRRRRRRAGRAVLSILAGLADRRRCSCAGSAGWPIR